MRSDGLSSPSVDVSAAASVIVAASSQTIRKLLGTDHAWASGALFSFVFGMFFRDLGFRWRIDCGVGRKTKLTHQCRFLGTLFKFRLPITPLPRVLMGQSSRMIGEADFLGVGFLGRINVFVSVPKPLMLEGGVERAERIGQIAFDHGFAELSLQDPIKHDASKL